MEVSLATKCIYFRRFRVLRLTSLALGALTLLLFVHFLAQNPSILNPNYVTRRRIPGLTDDDLQEWIVSRGKVPEKNALVDLNDFDFLINNESICQVLPKKDRLLGAGIDLMVIVQSALDHFTERQEIRHTWGSVRTFQGSEMRLVFLLGTFSQPHPEIQQGILKESAKFGDIASGNFHDSYRNLTYKHLMGYKWVEQFCPGVKFIYKTDDDVFTDIFQLIMYVGSTRLPLRDTLLCHVREGLLPIRKAKDGSKVEGEDWAVTFKEYPHEIYPKFCGGLAHLITPDYAARLLQVSRQTRFFRLDDVYIMGIVRLLARNLSEPISLNEKISFDFSDYRKWLEDGSNQKLPFIILEVDPSEKYSEEMKNLWGKTRRVWNS